jgi:signal peptidase I
MNKPDPRTRPPSPPRFVKFWKRWLRPLLVLAVGLFLLRWIALDWSVVPTGSMRPTILEGDYVLVNKLAYDVRVPLAGWKLTESTEPRRGDIVIFEPVGHSERYIKRILGLPGDTVQMRNYRLYVNSKPAGFDFPDPGVTPRLTDAGGDRWGISDLLVGRVNAAPLAVVKPADATFGPRRVPAGEYFVLGDNRGNSKDSRSFGFVPRDRVIGRAMRVLISLDPNSSWRPRFDRFFRPLS